jgi:hypothetical protein
VGQFPRQALEGTLAGGIGLEGSGDERGALGVDDDAGHLAAGDHLAEVQVAERGAVGDPPIFAFWVRPFRISEARLAE